MKCRINVCLLVVVGVVLVSGSACDGLDDGIDAECLSEDPTPENIDSDSLGPGDAMWTGDCMSVLEDYYSNPETSEVHPGDSCLFYGGVDGCGNNHVSIACEGGLLVIYCGGDMNTADIITEHDETCGDSASDTGVDLDSAEDTDEVLGDTASEQVGDSDSAMDTDMVWEDTESADTEYVDTSSEQEIGWNDCNTALGAWISGETHQGDECSFSGGCGSSQLSIWCENGQLVISCGSDTESQDTANSDTDALTDSDQTCE